MKSALACTYNALGGGNSGALSDARNEADARILPLQYAASSAVHPATDFTLFGPLFLMQACKTGEKTVPRG